MRVYRYVCVCIDMYAFVWSTVHLKVVLICVRVYGRRYMWIAITIATHMALTHTHTHTHTHKQTRTYTCTHTHTHTPTPTHTHKWHEEYACKWRPVLLRSKGGRGGGGTYACGVGAQEELEFTTCVSGRGVRGKKGGYRNNERCNQC